MTKTCSSLILRSVWHQPRVNVCVVGAGLGHGAGEGFGARINRRTPRDDAHRPPQRIMQYVTNRLLPLRHPAGYEVGNGFDCLR